MRILPLALLTLLLVPSALANEVSGETYKVRHTRDYDRFFNAFAPYQHDFLLNLRKTHPTIYDFRLSKVFVIESVNDAWLLEILFDKRSRDWNHIELPSDVMQEAFGTGMKAKYTDTPSQISSGASLYPSFTKPRGNGIFLPSHKSSLQRAAEEVTPEMIAWVRLNLYSLRNPITQKNVPTATLSDEQIKAYLLDRKTKKIANITPEKAEQELHTVGAYYKLYQQRMKALTPFTSSFP